MLRNIAVPAYKNTPEIVVYNLDAPVRIGRFKCDQHHVHVCSSGERYPVYRAMNTGLIDLSLCTYMGVVRRHSPSVNTRLQKLRGAAAIAASIIVLRPSAI